MEITEKIVKKIMEIIEVSGFHITSYGDNDADISDIEWNLSNKFYFDNQKELEDFKENLYLLFENYCGGINIETFNERQIQIEKENREQYESFPMRFLIKDGSNFKKAGSTASYSSAVGDGIHMELPSWMSVDEYNCDDKIIKSTDPEFREILLGEASRLEDRIRNDEYGLKNAKRNLKLIQQELKYGK